MAEALPVVRASEMVRALERAGWVRGRQTGSDLHLRHPERPGRVTVPMHNRTIAPGTLRAILRQAGMTADHLRRLL